MPSQEDFHQYLRTQIRQATRVVMKEVMREELEGFVGAAWGRVHQPAKGTAMGLTPVI